MWKNIIVSSPKNKAGACHEHSLSVFSLVQLKNESQNGTPPDPLELFTDSEKATAWSYKEDSLPFGIFVAKNVPRWPELQFIWWIGQWRRRENYFMASLVKLNVWAFWRLLWFTAFSFITFAWWTPMMCGIKNKALFWCKKK